MLATRVNITIKEDLKEKIDEYNRNNPYEKINVSQVAQRALYQKLMEVTRADIKVTA
jgi:hypothetical protein